MGEVPAGHLVLLDGVDEDRPQHHGKHARLHGLDQMAVKGTCERGEHLVPGSAAQNRSDCHGKHHLAVKLEACAQLLGEAHAAHHEDGHAGVEVNRGRVMVSHKVEQRLDDDAATEARHGTKRRCHNNHQRIYEIQHAGSFLGGIWKRVSVHFVSFIRAPFRRGRITQNKCTLAPRPPGSGVYISFHLFGLRFREPE